ncbi:MAG TPA: PAS domain S-box protein, partial [Fibrella sp.]
SGLPHNLPRGLDVDFALQAARLGVWEYDPLTGIANWDQRCQELYGLTQQSLVSYQQAFEYVHPEDADLVREAVAKVLTPQSGGYYDVTFRIIVGEDKRLRWVRFMGKAEFTPAGEPYRLAGVAQDVTQPLLAQQEEMLRFKYMADNARDPFILMRQDGSFAYLNELALQRWGYTQEEARHIRVPDVDPIYNDEKFGAVFAQAQTAPIPPFETLHRRKDGIIYPVEVSMGGLVLDGQPHLFAIARDITERIEAQQALAQSEAILRGAVELAQLATWSLDVPSGQITYSDRYQQWSGADESTPMAIAFNPVHPRDKVRIQAAVAKALSPEGGGIYTEEFTLVNQKTGQERIVQAWGRTYFDEQGKPLTLTGIAQNVTEQRATQQALENQVKQRTQQLEAANDELAATIDELRASNKQQALIRQLVEESEARYRQLSQQLETQVQERTKDLEAVNKELAATHEELLTSYKEQVLARQQLEDSATALQNAMELAELGNWRVDVATSLTTLSPRLADWFGFESLTADAESFLACIAEGD